MFWNCMVVNGGQASSDLRRRYLNFLQWLPLRIEPLSKIKIAPHLKQSHVTHQSSKTCSAKRNAIFFRFRVGLQALITNTREGATM